MHTSEQYVSQELWDNSKEQCIKFKDKENQPCISNSECKQDWMIVVKAPEEQTLNQIYDGQTRITDFCYL
jgi:hypothetical protein